uniref:Uncharacterized protein n=1 Tax=Arundo donax TaxID=35708 RepID=A0A0A9FSE0_ARUDO
MQSTLLNCSKTVWLASGKTYSASEAENRLRNSSRYQIKSWYLIKFIC